MHTISRPVEGEYAPYTIAYISKVSEDKPVLEQLIPNMEAMFALVGGFSEAALVRRWAEGEWTIKEILLHVMDTERIMAYRALRIARHDTTPLAGFEQDDYIPYSQANARSLDSIMEEYRSIRMASLNLFKHFSELDCLRMGTCSNTATSVRALVYIVAGHELHHFESIQENYGEG